VLLFVSVSVLQFEIERRTPGLEIGHMEKLQALFGKYGSPLRFKCAPFFQGGDAAADSHPSQGAVSSIFSALVVINPDHHDHLVRSP
jgi:hypothetical protein